MIIVRYELYSRLLLEPILIESESMLDGIFHASREVNVGITRPLALDLVPLRRVFFS